MAGAMSEDGHRSLEDFSRGDLLGNGSFCDVLRCTERRSGSSYAMKVVPKRKSPHDQAIAVEEHCLKRLAASPSVVNLICSFDSPLEWIGVLEFCEGGELWAHIKDCGCCLEGEAPWYAAQMVEALAAVHDAGIVHRDVKCENYLLTAEQRLKIIDFGTARDDRHPEVQPMLLGPQYEHHVGTPNFMAPEAIHGKANDQRSDLWSLGCAVYQLVLGAPPFNASTPFLVMDKAQKGNLWMPALGFEDDLRDLVRKLVCAEPGARLGAAGGRTRAVLEHPFLARRPDGQPPDTPLAAGLRRCARAGAAEAASAEAADAARQEDGGYFTLGGPPAPPQSEPGVETAKLLQELPAVLDGQGCADPAGQALLTAVREAAAGATSAPAEFAAQLARAVEAVEALPASARALLGRCAEVVEQRRKEASAEVTLDEDESELESEEASDDYGAKPKAGGAGRQGQAEHDDVDDRVRRPRRCCFF